MGRAARWVKALLGCRRHRKRDKNKNGNPVEAAPPPSLRSFRSESEKEQNKHAIAVAAATAAAADVAVAAAQAAVAVVRLTSRGRGCHERWAAVKIQSAFRAYLARKALRALKLLVKLQALVRGYLVRKQTVSVLQSMQALMRLQTSIRSQRSPILAPNNARSDPRNSLEYPRSEQTPSPHCRRMSMSTNGFDKSPKIINIDRCPSRLSMPNRRILHDYEPRCVSSACSTPSKNTGIANGALRRPASALDCPNYPNYMLGTRSFIAKVRAQSAPKQRPEGKMESRASLSGLGKAEVLSFKSAVRRRLDRCVELRREEDRECHLERK